MRWFLLMPVFAVALFFPVASRADTPATEFFVIETAKLTKLAPTDAALDTLSGLQLAEISMAHGSYSGGLSMRLSTQAFRIDAHFSSGVNLTKDNPATLEYHIDASSDQTSWNLFSVQGTAIPKGKQYITQDWDKQPVSVVLRFLDLKH